MLKSILAVCFYTALVSVNIFANSTNNPKSSKNTINFTITIVEKSSNTPLQGVVITVRSANSLIAQSATNYFGKAVLKDLAAGKYDLATHFIGYKDFVQTVVIDSSTNNIDIALEEKALELGAVVIEGHRENKVSTTIDITTGRQNFEGESYHATPKAGIITLIQENLAGASKAPTGEVHIRGQHGEFSYIVDGLQIPIGVFGGLNEIVDPIVISHITFYTSGFPAEFGGQIAGLIDIENKIPTGKFRLDASTYFGSYITSTNENLGEKVGSFKSINSNGQSISLSDHLGKLGYAVSASRQETNRRIDQPTPKLFNDHGFDYFGYSKFDYLLSPIDFLTMNLNYSETSTQVPYNPNIATLQDKQVSSNGFQTLSYFHTFSSLKEKESNLFVGIINRQGSMNFLPDIFDSNPVYLGSDTITRYMVEQNRSFNTIGFKTKFDNALSHHFKYAIGFNYNYTTGKEDFRFFTAAGTHSNNSSEYVGSDFGAFFQTELHPFEWTRFDLGLRYDIHNAPEESAQKAFSPRFKWNIFYDELTTLTFSYDKLFMPLNIESLGKVASLLGGNQAATKAEQDNLYEIAVIRNWNNNINSKLAAFYKESSPGLDDQTLGSSTIRVNININQIKVTGLELALTYNDRVSPVSGFINTSIIHAYGQGPVSGGFLPITSGTNAFDLDHDQRLSAVLGLNYQPENYFVNITANYSSGLSNFGKDIQFKTGLFDMNTSGHTSPALIFDASFGYTFSLFADHTLEPSLYITNILDHPHLIKGAFFSGASYEERRNLVVKISYHL